jgi:D-sedoheptulose 7-phosphate isomerase
MVCKEFIDEYLSTFVAKVNSFNGSKIVDIINALKKAKDEDRTIFVIGNGGSAATANHFACDFGKNAVKSDEGRFRIISLSESVSCITAYGNDISFDSVFEEQLKNLMRPGDILIAISASGKSPNIIKAVNYAKAKGGMVIGLSGFDGGLLKNLSDINVNIDFDTYEQIEDFHLIITHIIVYCFKKLGN